MAGKGPAVYRAPAIVHNSSAHGGLTHRKARARQRRRFLWLLLLALCLFGGSFAYRFLKQELKTETVIKQAAPRIARAVYETKTKQYQEADFSLSLPLNWQSVSRPAGTPYQSYSWQSNDRVTNGQEITIYEDTIPVNFAVNRVLVVSGQQDHVQVEGSVSDNCSTFTKGITPTAGQTGVPAKWQNVSFLCDQFNQERDVVGTSSTDGVNKVMLKSLSTADGHSFFFTYTVNDITPDYSTFLAALQSFRMQ